VWGSFVQCRTKRFLLSQKFTALQAEAAETTFYARAANRTANLSNALCG
jgi:hypothetical protein